MVLSTLDIRCRDYRWCCTL